MYFVDIAQVLVENERDQLSTHVQELESIQQTLEREVGALQGRLTAEQTKSRALENNKKEVCVSGVMHIYIFARIILYAHTEYQLHVCVFVCMLTMPYTYYIHPFFLFRTTYFHVADL